MLIVQYDRRPKKLPKEATTMFVSPFESEKPLPPPVTIVNTGPLIGRNRVVKVGDWIGKFKRSPLYGRPRPAREIVHAR